MTRRTFHGQLLPQFNPFSDDFLTEMLKATCVAWTRMRHPTAPEIEDRITRRLVGCLTNDLHFRELPYDVTCQHWLLGADGAALGRIDLRFKHRYSQSDYFAFEAKRLHVTYPGGHFSTEYPTYTGSQGMMAFIEGHYSRGLSVGGMLAYVMDARSADAWFGLEKMVSACCDSLKLVTASQFIASSLADAVLRGARDVYLGETLHDLKTYELRLFHLVLPVGIKKKRSVSRPAAARSRH